MRQTQAKGIEQAVGIAGLCRPPASVRAAHKPPDPLDQAQFAQALQSPSGGRWVAQRALSDRGVCQIQPTVIAQRRDEHLGYVKIAGGESIAGPVLAGKKAEAGAAVTIERLTWTVAEDRITSPFGHSVF